MFTDSEIERLSAFLNVPVRYQHRDKQPNQSPKTDKISNELREKFEDIMLKLTITALKILKQQNLLGRKCSKLF